MFKFAIEVCFENHFGLIQAIFLSLGSTKSVYFFWDTRYLWSNCFNDDRKRKLICQTSACPKNKYRVSQKKFTDLVDPNDKNIA